jgi:hypothetical protein
LAGFEIHRFVAINNSVAEMAGTTRLRSIDATLSVTGAGYLKLDFRDLDFDGVPDANILGVGVHPAMPSGSYIRVGGAAVFVADSVLPAGGNSDSDGDYEADGQPSQMAAFTTDLRSIQVVGSQPAENSPTATEGRLFATAIVPTGTEFRAFGTLAAETGLPVAFDVVIPEPHVAGWLGISSLGLLGRRWRRA